MGDMADFYLDIAFQQVEHYSRYQDADLQTQYDEGIIDELGATIGDPSSLPVAAPLERSIAAPLGCLIAELPKSKLFD